MSGGPGRAGPVPIGSDPGDYDRLRRRVLWSLPTGLYVVGSRSDAGGQVRANLMTANLVVQVSVDPKVVAVAVEADALTRRLIEEGRCFTVCLLDRADRALVRKFVKPVADLYIAPDGRLAAMNGEAVTVGVTGAPVLARSAAWLDCTLRQRIELGSHVLFLGEVVDVAGPSEGAVPDVLRMEDTRMSYGG